MDPKVERRAKELADALVESQAYRKVQEARRIVQEHEAAKIMLSDFQSKQDAVQRKMMGNERVSDQEWEELRRVSEIVSLNPYVRQLMETEYEFAQTMVGIQKILADVMGLPTGQDEEPELGVAGAGSEGAPKIEAARPRLWTPGSRP